MATPKTGKPDRWEDLPLEELARRAGIKHIPDDPTKVRRRSYGTIIAEVNQPFSFKARCNNCGWKEDDSKLALKSAEQHALDSDKCYDIDLISVSKVSTRVLGGFGDGHLL